MGRWVWLMVMLSVSAATAGCLDPTTDDVADMAAPPRPRVSAPEVQAFAATGCHASALGIPVDFSLTDPWLPAGFTAIDSSQFVFAPVNTGLGAVVLVALQCSNTTHGSPMQLLLVSILVDDPSVDGTPSAFHSLYVTHFLTNATPLAGVLGAWDWNQGGVMSQVVEHSMDPPAGAPDSPLAPQREDRPKTSSVTGSENETAYQWRTSGTTMYFVGDETLRFWHQSPDGLSFLELVPDEDGIGGGAVCLFDEGTAIHEVLQSRTCLPGVENGQAAFGLAVDGFGMQGRLHRMPGVYAA